MSNRETGIICLACFQPTWELLRKQLESIQAQTLTSWTAHIGIDGRDNDLEQRLKALLSSDNRFMVHNFDKRVGHYRNFERLLEFAEPHRGWIALADQDDYWYPEKLASMVPYLENSDLVCGQARVVEVRGNDRVVQGQTNRRGSSLASLFVDNRVTGSFSIMRSEILAVALPFPPATDAAFHDHWLGICAKASNRLLFIHEVLQDYHQHASNVIGEESKDSLHRKIARLRLRRTANSGPLDLLRYLAEHRWGWRSNMARSLVSKGPQLAAESSTLLAFSRGRFNFRLFHLIGREVLGRTVPASRGIGLVAGSLVQVFLRKAR